MDRLKSLTHILGSVYAGHWPDWGLDYAGARQYHEADSFIRIAELIVAASRTQIWERVHSMGTRIASAGGPPQELKTLAVWAVGELTAEHAGIARPLAAAAFFYREEGARRALLQTYDRAILGPDEPHRDHPED